MRMLLNERESGEPEIKSNQLSVAGLLILDIPLPLQPLLRPFEERALKILCG